jgi:hypothetical protein
VPAAVAAPIAPAPAPVAAVAAPPPAPVAPVVASPPPPVPEVKAPEPPPVEAVETPKPAPAPAPAKRRKVAVAHPKAAPLSAEVLEGLKERLGRAVPGIRQCAMLSKTGREGTLGLRVVVEPNGQVGNIALSGVDLGDKLEACIRDAVRRVRFDAFDGSPATLERSVVLAPRQ